MKANPTMYEVPLTGSGDSALGEKADLSGVTITRLIAQLLWTSQHDRHGNFDPAPADLSVTARG